MKPDYEQLRADLHRIYRQEHDQLAASGAAFGLTETERDVISRLPRGVGLWKVPGRAFIVRHDLHPAEFPIVDSDAAMRDAPGDPATGPRSEGV